MRCQPHVIVIDGLNAGGPCTQQSGAVIKRRKPTLEIQLRDPNRDMGTAIQRQCRDCEGWVEQQMGRLAQIVAFDGGFEFLFVARRSEDGPERIRCQNGQKIRFA